MFVRLRKSRNTSNYILVKNVREGDRIRQKYLLHLGTGEHPECATLEGARSFWVQRLKDLGQERTEAKRRVREARKEMIEALEEAVRLAEKYNPSDCLAEAESSLALWKSGGETVDWRPGKSAWRWSQLDALRHLRDSDAAVVAAERELARGRDRLEKIRSYL